MSRECMDCRQDVTSATEYVFGEVLLCSFCFDKAWREFASVVSRLPPMEDFDESS